MSVGDSTVKMVATVTLLVGFVAIAPAPTSAVTGWGVSAPFHLDTTESGVCDHYGSIPGRVVLEQNYANPFSSATTIRYGLPREGRVRLTVHDVSGRGVALLVDKLESAGYHTVAWDGHDSRWHRISSGMYFYRLETDSGCSTRNLILVR